MGAKYMEKTNQNIFTLILPVIIAVLIILINQFSEAVNISILLSGLYLGVITTAVLNI